MSIKSRTVKALSDGHLVCAFRVKRVMTLNGPDDLHTCFGVNTTEELEDVLSSQMDVRMTVVFINNTANGTTAILGTEGRKAGWTVDFPCTLEHLMSRVRDVEADTVAYEVVNDLELERLALP